MIGFPQYVATETLLALYRRDDIGMLRDERRDFGGSGSDDPPVKALSNSHGPVLLVSEQGVRQLGGDYEVGVLARDVPSLRRRATKEQEGAFGIWLDGLGTFRVDRATQNGDRVVTNVEVDESAYMMNAWSNERWIMFLGGVDGGRFLVAYNRLSRKKRLVAVGGSRREGSLCGQPLASDAAFLVGKDQRSIYRIELESGSTQVFPTPVPLDSVDCVSVNSGGTTIVVTGLVDGKTKSAIGNGRVWSIMDVPDTVGILEPVVGEEWIVLRDPAYTVTDGRTGAIAGAGAVFLVLRDGLEWHVASKVLAPSLHRGGSLGFEFAHNGEELFLNYFDADVEALTQADTGTPEGREALWRSMRTCVVRLHGSSTEK
jgi:hypothetical protein